MTADTEPEVFVIESLKFKDEHANLFEGDIISRILGLGGKECKYYYVRTRKELRSVLGFFEESRYRYLHLSCHANNESMATTLDDIPFTDLGKMLNGRLDGRRVFLSACSMASEKLAAELMPDSGCFSILGPSEDVIISNSAIMWASLYHLMFKADHRVMKRETLSEKARVVGAAFGIRLNLFVKDGNEERGYRLIKVRPQASRAPIIKA